MYEGSSLWSHFTPNKVASRLAQDQTHPPTTSHVNTPLTEDESHLLESEGALLHVGESLHSPLARPLPPSRPALPAHHGLEVHLEVADVLHPDSLLPVSSLLSRLQLLI